MLTTLNRAKKLMGIEPGDDFRDDEISMLLSAASSAVEDYCRRTFRLQSHTEKVSGRRGEYLQLKNYPVHSATVYERMDQPYTDVEMLDDGILFRPGGWPGGERSITVSYDAGYVLPSDEPGEPAATLPAAIEYAVVLMIQHMERAPGVTAERVGDLSVSYSPNDLDMPAAAKALLSSYVRPEV